MHMPAKVFVSYSHRDESFWPDLQDQLKILRNKKYLDWWVDRDIVPGSEWEKEILENLAAADVILLLVSTHFLASDFCWGVELAAAMDRHDAGKARVVPIFLRVCDIEETPIAKVQGVPSRDKPVSKWGDRHAAWTEVAKGIQAAVNEWRELS